MSIWKNMGPIERNLEYLWTFKRFGKHLWAFGDI
jgi:hypothetical protein